MEQDAFRDASLWTPVRARRVLLKADYYNQTTDPKARRTYQLPLHRHRTAVGAYIVRIVVIVTAAVLGVLLVLRLYGGRTPTALEATPSLRHRYMEVIIPIHPRSDDVDLCRTIVSAQILNYPVPVVVPWGNASVDSQITQTKRIHDKVMRIYSYLSSLPSEAHDAIVVLLDGPDTWFQLRPDMLLQAYFEANARTDRRLEEAHGRGVQQKVIFSSFETCGSRYDNSTVCSGIPEAPEDGAPKFLGHGAMVGQAQDVRKIVEHTLNRLELAKDPSVRLLPVLSQMLTEQESWRKQRHEEASDEEVTPELGIGLDYYNEIGISMASDATLTWKSPQKVLQRLQRSTPPYWTVSGLETGLPHGRSWADLEMITGFNDSVPAMIHHWPTLGMRVKDSTGNRGKWWKSLWLTDSARALYTASERLPSTVVAQVHDDQGRETLFWNRQPSHNRMGAWLPNMRDFLHFEELCGADHEWREIFGDDSGPWTRTEYF